MSLPRNAPVLSRDLPAMEHYDLVILGAGSGNSLVTDEMNGWRIAIVERAEFGGTCLNRGCIPTKMYVHAADVAHDAAHAGGRLGVSTAFLDADWPAIVRRTFGRIDPIAAGGEAYRRGLEHVTVYAGDARFVGHKTLEVDGQRFTGDRIVIAVGGRPMIPDLPGLSEVAFHTSDTVMRLAERPERMVILGGGFIACEFAHVFASFGTEVTMINRGPFLLKAEDADISRRFTELMAQRVHLRTGSRIERISPAGSGSVAVDLVSMYGPERVEADALLVATGRVLNGDTLDVEATGLQLGADGEVPVDEFGRTAVDGIWALGDCNGRYQLKHMANGEARVVAHNLVHPDDPRRFEHRPAPHAVFSSPQVASVGLTEEQAMEADVDFVAITHQYASAAWGWALEDRSSFVKLLGDPSTGTLLGAHVIGPQASTLISLLVQGMYLGNTVREMARDVVYIHPAPSEVVEQALIELDLRMN